MNSGSKQKRMEVGRLKTDVFSKDHKLPCGELTGRDSSDGGDTYRRLLQGSRYDMVTLWNRIMIPVQLKEVTIMMIIRMSNCYNLLLG